MTAVVVPFRSSCPHRTAVWAWLRKRWCATFPDWPVIEAADGPGPWRKGAAVASAIAATSAETIVVADADVWAPTIAGAVEAVERGALWAVSHRYVARLSERGTARAIDGVDELGALAQRPRYLAEPRCTAMLGGGIVVLQRASWALAPMDPRFEGWGGEDQAWGYALATLLGAPVAIPGTLIHCWHPPQDRRSRSRGSAANEALRLRYARAQRHPDLMRALVAEAAG